MTAEEMNSCLAALASNEPSERTRAARAIYEAGSAMARAATREWRSDAELARLFRGEPTVGIAVMTERFESIRRASGMPKLAAVPPDQDAREFSLEFPGGVSLDVLTPREPDGTGAIARFLGRRGEDIQQVEFPVTDVDRAMAILRERFRIDPVYPETRAGADGTRVNFLLVSGRDNSGTPSGQKVLIELVEEETGKD